LFLRKPAPPRSRIHVGRDKSFLWHRVFAAAWDGLALGVSFALGVPGGSSNQNRHFQLLAGYDTVQYRRRLALGFRGGARCSNIRPILSCNLYGRPVSIAAFTPTPQYLSSNSNASSANPGSMSGTRAKSGTLPTILLRRWAGSRCSWCVMLAEALGSCTISVPIAVRWWWLRTRATPANSSAAITAGPIISTAA